MKEQNDIVASDQGRKRLYSDREISELIRRATELQDDEKALPERGVSLQEIERIAAEIGINPEHLRAAALELESGLHERDGLSVWGGPFLLGQKRVVEGSVTDEEWARIVLELRRMLGSRGNVEQIGQMREWSREVKDMDFRYEQTQVSISPGEDQTTIEIRSQFRGGAYVAYLAGIVVSGTVAGAFLDGAGLSDLMNTIILGSSGVGGLAVARASIGAWASRRRRQLKQVMDWLESSIAQPAALAAGEPQYDERLELAEGPSMQPTGGTGVSTSNIVDSL
jgi:hypothetical protein